MQTSPWAVPATAHHQACSPSVSQWCRSPGRCRRERWRSRLSPLAVPPTVSSRGWLCAVGDQAYALPVAQLGASAAAQGHRARCAGAWLLGATFACGGVLGPSQAHAQAGYLDGHAQIHTYSIANAGFTASFASTHPSGSFGQHISDDQVQGQHSTLGESLRYVAHWVSTSCHRPPGPRPSTHTSHMGYEARNPPAPIHRGLLSHQACTTPACPPFSHRLSAHLHASTRPPNATSHPLSPHLLSI